METTFDCRRDWIKIKFCHKWYQMEFQIFFHAVTFLSSSLSSYVLQITEAFPRFSPTLFVKDPTEPEEQKYLLLLYGLRFSAKKSSQARRNTRELSL